VCTTALVDGEVRCEKGKIETCVESCWGESQFMVCERVVRESVSGLTPCAVSDAPTQAACWSDWSGSSSGSKPGHFAGKISSLRSNNFSCHCFTGEPDLVPLTAVTRTRLSRGVTATSSACDADLRKSHYYLN